ncbi:MAG: alpha/beta hydrolase [Microbacteriaceae bacterium]|nr:alpha/beta hydrolase [Microbacteriaceae bacterium]
MTQVRRVHRPATDDSPEFDLAYMRTGPHHSTPLVIIPGGPGLGSIRPYRALRTWATWGGLDVIMVEHRGVGRSRNDVRGRPLPHSAMWVRHVVDDLAAVLDHEGIERVFIAGSSYGSFLATSFGMRYPERVAGILLDSALQATEDLQLERALIRELFSDADTPLARSVRQLLTRTHPGEREVLDVVRAAYELGGSKLAQAVVSLRLRHRFSPTWWALERYALRDESIAHVRGHYEFDIAGAIGFRELNYGAMPDGLPLDPALTYAPLADRFPPFLGTPIELRTDTFEWPLVLLVGDRDIRTPPAIAARVASHAPHPTLVEIHNGHSALDTHPAAFLNAARELVRGTHGRLPSMAERLNRLPRRGLAARLPTFLSIAARIEAVLSPRCSAR